MGNHEFLRVELLRHGETEGGVRYRGTLDDPLTPVGWEQMWTAVADVRCDIVVSSPLSRCADFARAFAQRHALPLHIDERLREMDFGKWEGRTAAGLMQSEPDALMDFWRDPWSNSPPGGEALRHLQSRVLEALQDITAQRRPALVVTHGGPIRMLLCRMLQHPPEQILELSVPHASRHTLRMRVEQSHTSEIAAT